MLLFLTCRSSDPIIYVPPILGCMDEFACNYSADAESPCLLDDEECEVCDYETCVGCMDELACNYDETATVSDQNGIYDISEFFIDCNEDLSICENDNDWDSQTMGNGTWDDGEAFTDCYTFLEDQIYVRICQGDEGFNSELANGTWDDGEAFTDTNQDGTWEEGEDFVDGSCSYEDCAGCLDSTACNYEGAEAFVDANDNGVYDCTVCDSSDPGYDGEVFTDTNQNSVWDAGNALITISDESSCEYLSCSGCLDDGSLTLADDGYDSPHLGIAACNYQTAEAFVDANDNGVYDCTVCDSSDPGYDGEVFTDDNGNGLWDVITILDQSSCDYLSCSGCLDLTACNYDNQEGALTINNSDDCYFNHNEWSESVELAGSAQDSDGVCLMPDNTIYITESGIVLYNLTEDIYGFQFNIYGANVSDSSSGDAQTNGLTVQPGQAGIVIGYSVSADDFIPMGCGTLTELVLDGSISQVSNIIFSNELGQSIGTSYLSGCNCDLESDLDCFGICGGDNLECVDCEGTLNGSATEDCLGVCGGLAINDCSAASGSCVASQEACNDLIALQEFITANPNLAASLINPTPQSLFDEGLAGKNSENDRVSWIQIIDKGVSAITSSFQNLTELKILNLSSNSLNNLSSNVTSLNNLTSLNVSFNNISSLPANIIELTELTDLNVDGNIISSLPSLSPLAKLETLDVGSNQLSELPSLPSSLQTIYADHNSLSSLPSGIGSLNYIDVSYNQITELPAGICNTISALNITGNQICPETEFQLGGQYYTCSNLGTGLIGADGGQVCDD